MTQTSGTIIVGSFNKAKAAEMVGLLSDLHLPVRSMAEFEGVEEIPEDGTTFAANSRLKAVGLAKQVAGPGILGVVADDSGIVVDAMDGRPGVYSARYVSESATDPERMRQMLTELDGVPVEKRTARFCCHIVLSDGERVLLETSGVVEGRIAFEPAGNFGFGYDPIFIPQGYDKTFAELGPEVKHQISHRAKALRDFHNILLRWLKDQNREE